ncbi:MAG: GNAT family N-acetyltransferase [Lachnospiraceae bacterium]
MRLVYETKHLLLKILQPDAAGQVLDFYLRNPDFERWEPQRPPKFYTKSYQYALMQGEYNAALSLSAVRFWIFEKQNPDQIIGTINFHEIQRSIYQKCQTGYKFDHAFRHKGYATEAMVQTIRVMFHDLKLHRIEAYVMPSNTPSLHLLENLGFEQEGYLRRFVQINGQWEDHYLYALLNESAGTSSRFSPS